MKLLCTFVTYNFAKVGLSDNFVFVVNSILAESFYYVKYGLPIIPLIIPLKILSYKN